LRTSLEAFSAASELTRASELTHKAALEYYSKGLGTLTDLTAAHSGLLQARLARAKAHSDALIASATLAFATGAIVHPGAR
jgi:outer membrane protein